MRFPTEDQDLTSLVYEAAEFSKARKVRDDERILVGEKAKELSREFASEITAFVKEANPDGKLPIELKTMGNHNVVHYYHWELWYEFAGNKLTLKLVKNVDRQTIEMENEIFVGRRCDLKPDASGWQSTDIVWVKDFNDADKTDTRELARRSLHWLIKSQKLD
jgi:hypothetical protein